MFTWGSRHSRIPAMRALLSRGEDALIFVITPMFLFMGFAAGSDEDRPAIEGTRDSLMLLLGCLQLVVIGVIVLGVAIELLAATDWSGQCLDCEPDVY